MIAFGRLQAIWSRPRFRLGVKLIFSGKPKWSCGLFNDSIVRWKDLQCYIQIHKTLLPTTRELLCTNTISWWGGEKNCPNDHVSEAFTQNVKGQVCILRSMRGLATETSHGRTKEINPVNQTRKTKLNWKHTLGTLKSLDKRMCVYAITSAGWITFSLPTVRFT